MLPTIAVTTFSANLAKAIWMQPKQNIKLTVSHRAEHQEKNPKNRH
jgi:hypothetical protein